jgi:hypothetical protein
VTESEKSALLDLEAVAEARPKSFAPAELITCDECLRANPPSRSQCLYCGANLPQKTWEHSETRAQPAEIDKPAKATEACYLVLRSTEINTVSEASLAEIASILHVKPQEMASLIGVGRSVPLARCGTAEQATVLAARLRSLGIEVSTFREDKFDLDLPARKIRALEFSDDAITAKVLKGGDISAAWSDLILIVIGRLIVRRVEVEERKRRGRAKPLDTRELFSNEPVMDLYTGSNEVAWRISPNGFDFSCLGSEKSMTAFQNFSTLIDRVQIRAPKAEVDDSYRNLRPVLANIWSLEPETRKGEWRRSGAGKVDVATVTTTNNEAQFNYYSRLRYRLKLGELEDGQ